MVTDDELLTVMCRRMQGVFNKATSTSLAAQLSAELHCLSTSLSAPLMWSLPVHQRSILQRRPCLTSSFLRHGLIVMRISGEAIVDDNVCFAGRSSGPRLTSPKLKAWKWLCVQVTSIMVPLLKFYFHEEVRSAAMSILPELLRSASQAAEKGVQGANAQYVKQLLDFFWQPLMDAMAKVRPVRFNLFDVYGSLFACLALIVISL